MNTVAYNNEDKTPVQLGDRVTIRRFLFWKYSGTVVYVPGISPKRKDMEYDGLQWIAVKYDDGLFVQEAVDPEIHELCNKNVKFISRGDQSVGITLDDVISEEDEYGREDDALFPPKPGIRLLKTSEYSLNKLSGNPNLPDGVEWPKNPKGIELDLLAQFQCEDLPRGLGLPGSGMLYFFYDIKAMAWGYEPSDKEHWKIIYTGLPPSSEPRSRTTKSNGEFREVFLKFQQFESALSDAYRVGEETDRHQLLGHPLWIQTLPEVMDKERILLLQIDSDDHEDGPGWMWCDAGRIYFTIKPEDLAARRFDRAILTLECY